MQSRGSLHLHALLWGLVTPEYLQRVSTNAELMEGVRRRVESTFVAHLPDHVHVSSIVKQLMGDAGAKPGECRTYHACPDPRTHPQEFQRHIDIQLGRTNVHSSHHATCIPKNPAFHKCRLDYRRRLEPETRMMQLKRTVTKPEGRKKAVIEISESATIDPPDVNCGPQRDRQRAPLPCRDTRPLYFAVERPPVRQPACAVAYLRQQNAVHSACIICAAADR